MCRVELCRVETDLWCVDRYHLSCLCDLLTLGDQKFRTQCPVCRQKFVRLRIKMNELALSNEHSPPLPNNNTMTEQQQRQVVTPQMDARRPVANSKGRRARGEARRPVQNTTTTAAPRSSWPCTNPNCCSQRRFHGGACDQELTKRPGWPTTGPGTKQQERMVPAMMPAMVEPAMMQTTLCALTTGSEVGFEAALKLAHGENASARCLLGPGGQKGRGRSHLASKWQKVSAMVPGKTSEQCRTRHYRLHCRPSLEARPGHPLPEASLMANKMIKHTLVVCLFTYHSLCMNPQLQEKVLTAHLKAMRSQWRCERCTREQMFTDQATPSPSRWRPVTPSMR